jgi:arsenical pump membrane protein
MLAGMAEADRSQHGAGSPGNAGSAGAGHSRTERRLGWLLAGLGAAGAAAAAVLRPAAASQALGQDWSPFVLVGGLLLIGLVANGDGLFAAAGQRLARLGGHGGVLFATAAATVGVVTALLNLDTSVAFLTPVLVYTARGRGDDEARLLYGSLLLANAGSLLLPGSNLTNLIVLGHLHLTGGRFLARMWLPWLAALAVTAVIVAVGERDAGRNAGPPVRPDCGQKVRSWQHFSTTPSLATATGGGSGPVFGVGLAAVALAAVMIVVLRSAAIPVAVTGIIAAGIRLGQGRLAPGLVAEVLGVPTLAGLLGLAVALGTLGRAWSGPAVLLAHLDSWGTAGVAAVASVLVNNLPAASLLAAGTPRHPFSLLVGLDLGPNLFVTGSLAWILWLRAARTAGARPSVARASRLGALAVPLSMTLAVGALILTGSH